MYSGYLQRVIIYNFNGTINYFFIDFRFLGIGPTWNKDMSRKISTLRQSMLKSEMVCYNIKVRGTEAAKWGATATDANCEDDEGFY